MDGTLIKEVGLEFRPTFIDDKLFYLALAAAPFALIAMSWLLPTWHHDLHISAPLALSVILWQPLVEELLFRGVVQGQFRNKPWARREIAGMSLANIVTSILFTLAHFIHHAPAWAALVMVPSLTFGYFRDRHAQVYPALILHAAYNGCYLLAGLDAGIAR